MTHLAIVTVGFVRGSRKNLRLGRIYSIAGGLLLVSTVSLGAALYPTFKVTVALPHLAAEAPWAVSLFEVKEALALLGVPLALGLLAVGRRFDSTDRPLVPAFALFAFGLCAIAWFCALAGLL